MVHALMLSIANQIRIPSRIEAQGDARTSKGVWRLVQKRELRRAGHSQRRSLHRLGCYQAVA